VGGSLNNGRMLYMTINELINALYNIEDLNAEVLRLEFNDISSELVVVVAKDENWEEEYKIKVK
jgi:hypothetical protein